MNINDNFYEISHKELSNAESLIGDVWMLLTLRDGEKVNAMTASWGSLGILWNKPVLTCFVRPQRHTYSLMEKEERFSVAFMPEAHRDALRLCGSKSGRDMDKLEASGLTSDKLDGVDVICEADTLIICKKLYVGDLEESGFVCPELLSNYKNNDFHRFYVCEIERVYKRK